MSERWPSDRRSCAWAALASSCATAEDGPKRLELAWLFTNRTPSWSAALVCLAKPFATSEGQWRCSKMVAVPRRRARAIANAVSASTSEAERSASMRFKSSTLAEGGWNRNSGVEGMI